MKLGPAAVNFQIVTLPSSAAPDDFVRNQRAELPSVLRAIQDVVYAGNRVERQCAQRLVSDERCREPNDTFEDEILEHDV